MSNKYTDLVIFKARVMSFKSENKRGEEQVSRQLLHQTVSGACLLPQLINVRAEGVANFAAGCIQ